MGIYLLDRKMDNKGEHERETYISKKESYVDAASDSNPNNDYVSKAHVDNKRQQERETHMSKKESYVDAQAVSHAYNDSCADNKGVQERGTHMSSKKESCVDVEVDSESKACADVERYCSACSREGLKRAKRKERELSGILGSYSDSVWR